MKATVKKLIGFSKEKRYGRMLVELLKKEGIAVSLARCTRECVFAKKKLPCDKDISLKFVKSESVST